MALALPSVDTNDAREARRLAARSDRHRAQREVWKITRLKTKREFFDPKTGEIRQSSRVAHCGRVMQDSAGGVAIKVTSGPDGNRAGFSGLQTCGSVWACPVCSEKINAARQHELERGIRSWIDAGHAVLFLTLTVRHNKGHRLADLWDSISPAWNATTSGAGPAWNGTRGKPVNFRGGKALAREAELLGEDPTWVGQYCRWRAGDAALYGIRGYCRLVETKHGENGWHPHVHALLFIEKPLSGREVDLLRSSIFGRWETALAKDGLSVLESVGVDLRPVVSGDRLADYFAKNTYGIQPAAAAYEVTGSQSKQAGKGGRTPFQVLRDLVEQPRTADQPVHVIAERDQALAIWHEWEQASQGRRQLTWSRGMRDLLNLGEEETDQDLAEADLDGDDLLVFTHEEWTGHRLWEHRDVLLDAAEQGFLFELLPFIDRTRAEKTSRRLDNRPASGILDT